jgi:translation initiation factor IF-2
MSQTFHLPKQLMLSLLVSMFALHHLRVQAETDEVEIRLHSIIYKVIEEVETAMKGMLDPEFEEKVIGEAVVRDTFTVSKVGTIAGFMVLSGSVKRDASVRVIRDGCHRRRELVISETF